MKKFLMAAAITLIVTMAATTSAMAFEYQVAEPDEGMFAPSSSVEPVTVIGGGPTEQSNIDRSKNVAKAPPSFGSLDSYQPGTGETLISRISYGAASSGGASTNGIPNAGTVSGGTILSGSTAGTSGSLYYPPSDLDTSSSANITTTSSPASGGANLFTLPDGLYYSDGSLGRLKIPKLGLSVKVYEDESLENLAKGAGHIKSTSCWDGNVAIAGHNRGVTNHFGKIHTLTAGDQIVYTTTLGTRTYEVFSVEQIEETDLSRLERSNENLMTLITCVRDVRNMRWCIQAREVK